VPETREVFLEPWRLHRKAFDQLKQPSKAARETAASLKEFYQAQLSLFVEAAEEPGEAYEVLQKEFADFVDGWAQQDVMELFLEQGERGEERATGPPEKNKEEEESERSSESAAKRRRPDSSATAGEAAAKKSKTGGQKQQQGPEQRFRQRGGRRGSACGQGHGGEQGQDGGREQGEKEFDAAGSERPRRQGRQAQRRSVCEIRNGRCC
jgi:hypothetical protein